MNINKKNIKICYIGGGSRNWAWVLMKDLSFEKEIAGEIVLYDIDISAAQANADLGNQLMAEYNPGQWTFRVEGSIEKALSGSNFIFISILPMDFEEMEVDVHEPEKYGLYQSVGDTVGPGGLVRALRTIPMYQEIGLAIKQWAPEAWVLSYTNPMTICTKTLYEVFPEIKAFGCCHEVFGTQKLLKKAIVWAGLAKEEDIKREDIITRVLGINHFTWIDRATWKDIDLFPVYEKYFKAHYEDGVEGGGDDNWLNSFFESCERVKFDLFSQYGLIAAAGDRHLAEFCPPNWYLKDPETVKKWKFTLTPVSFRVSQREELKGKSLLYREGKEKMIPEDSGEEGIKQIKALLGLGNIVTNVNIPNKGQMPDLPLGAVVETNAFFSKDNLEPVLTEGLPNPLRSLTIQHVLNQDGILEAALERNLDKAFQVFLNDIQVRTLTREDAKVLFTTMIKTIPQEQGYSPLT